MRLPLDRKIRLAGRRKRPAARSRIRAARDWEELEARGPIRLSRRSRWKRDWAPIQGHKLRRDRERGRHWAASHTAADRTASNRGDGGGVAGFY